MLLKKQPVSEESREQQRSQCSFNPLKIRNLRNTSDEREKHPGILEC